MKNIEVKDTGFIKLFIRL